ncbi:MAG TPA: hypothetical protein VML19_33335 [Verrucomicrobiae bacterium]|nr:hypothetical protein [Verrucomicrobiae bacterium]
MKSVISSLAIVPCLVAGLAAQAPQKSPQPTAAELSALDLLKASRAAIGGGEPKTIQSLAISGAYRRGQQSSMMALSMDFSGRFLEEHTTMSNGGEIQRMGMTEDGPGSVGGGMPGDSGGPALTSNVTEALNGDTYWSKTGAGGTLSSGNDALKSSFRRIFIRYALAFALTPPENFPVTFAYMGRVESADGLIDTLEGKGADNFQVRVFLNIKTHLPMMIQYLSSQQGLQEVQLWLRDYKAEDGILVPHSLTWFTNGRVSEEFQVQKVKLNPRFPAGKFGK